MELFLKILVCFLAGAGAGIGTGFAGMSAAAVIGPILMTFLDIPAFCVQYHPEASPGPTDAHYLFTAFTRLMSGMPSAEALNIDITADRLAGWDFGRTVK